MSAGTGAAVTRFLPTSMERAHGQSRLDIVLLSPLDG